MLQHSKKRNGTKQMFFFQNCSLSFSLFFISQSRVQLDQLVRDGGGREHAQVGEEQRDEFFFFFGGGGGRRRGRKKRSIFVFALSFFPS